MEQNIYKYYAFISYKWEDGRWARRLQRKLESFRLPSALCKKYTIDNKPFKPTFFAETDIQPGPLDEELIKRLNDSKYLIVICSPRSAHSQWVGKEIEYFIKSGKEKQILLFIIDGIPYSDNPTLECIHPVIKKKLPEILGANVHEKGSSLYYIKRERAYVQIITKMLDIDFDVLWQRHKRQYIKKTITNILIALIFIQSLFFIWYSNQPFNVQMYLQETSSHNPHLHANVGEASFFIGTDTFSKQIDSIPTSLIFNSIHGKHRHTKVPVHFSLFGFGTIDTLILLERNITIPVKRIEAIYGKVKGYVRHARTDAFISGATVSINKYNVTTDHNGYFSLIIPLKEQRTFYQATIKYKKKYSEVQKVYPERGENTLINTLYIQ